MCPTWTPGILGATGRECVQLGHHRILGAAGRSCSRLGYGRYLESRLNIRPIFPSSSISIKNMRLWPKKYEKISPFFL